jgi:hypothetical protein
MFCFKNNLQKRQTWTPSYETTKSKKKLTNFFQTYLHGRNNWKRWTFREFEDV